MKINNNKYVNLPCDVSKIENNETIKADPKSAEASANEALCNFGKAFVNMSFKGNSSSFKIKEMTDKEYKEYKAKLEEKMKAVSYDEQSKIRFYVNKNNILVADKILSYEQLYKNEEFMKEMPHLLLNTGTNEKAHAKSIVIDKIMSDERLYGNERFIHYTANAVNFTNTIKEAQAETKLLDKILSDERLFGDRNFMLAIPALLFGTNHEEMPIKIAIIDKILSDERLYGNKHFINNSAWIINTTTTNEGLQAKSALIDKILTDEKLYNNKHFMKNAAWVFNKTKTLEDAQAKIAIIDKILSDKNLYGSKKFMKKAPCILSYVYSQEQMRLAERIISDKRLYGNKKFMDKIELMSYKHSPERADEIVELLDKKDLPIEQIIALVLDPYEELTVTGLKKMNKIIGVNKTLKFSEQDTIIASKFIDVYGKNNINELPIYTKREFLRKLVSMNTEMFNSSGTIRKYFPILPKTKEEYCALLPAVVRSLGIETNPLENDKLKDFNRNIISLSNKLKNLSDEEFNNLEIKQEYDKDKFINDVLDIVKDLSPNERQKVYDYFGFELHHNKNTKSGFSITGYPVNLNNGKKLAQITNENTKKVVEKLRANVVKFSENNLIACNNKEIEELLNNIIDVLPELRTSIGKLQAGNKNEDGVITGKGSHDFDVFKHSLKVMQKIAQDKNFQNLNKSDKKIILITSLLHDITKKEGYVDKTHAIEGSFDAFFISKKFNLTQEEEIKLYNLIRHHEWLGYINTSKDKSILDYRLKNMAYDLRHDNMLDIALMFTHADLKAVKKDDSFHNKKEGESRKDFNGNIRSFGESADYYGKKMRNIIEELKPTQPFLPVTKIPKSSEIEKIITTVNPDGSTNIKGLYKDKDGLIIIKYNELQNKDLEKIGFPKGSITKGMQSTTDLGEKVNTGSIKFFAHGLDYPDQLVKFDALSLVDSDALLSVSYAERPESKYRFFRPQGVLLDCETKYIHGGGNSDAGSGCKKSVQSFKDKYVFSKNIFTGNEDKKERSYIADLIKKTTGMNDNEYINFVKKYENKPLSAIEPVGLRTKIINAYATINSNTRKGQRSYNEIYISNPKPPMAVFAYNMKNENINNPVNFLKDLNVKKRTDFLREYALERDIPFVIFGN